MRLRSTAYKAAFAKGCFHELLALKVIEAPESA